MSVVGKANKESELKDICEKYNISVDDICIVGSYILEEIGVRESNDIDFIILESQREKITKSSKNIKTSSITELVSKNWHPVLKDDEIINNEEHHSRTESGFKIINVSLLIDRKKSTLRKKDIVDLKLIEKYLKDASPVKKEKIVGFLWSPAMNSWDDILTKMINDGILDECSLYDFGEHEEEYAESILKIYETDDISLEKVKNVKIKSMEPYSNSYMMFVVNIDPKYRTKQASGKPISTTVESIKKQIRTAFMPAVKNYIHDIIIHVADNTEQTELISQWMKKYEIYREDTIFTLKKLFREQFVLNDFHRVDILVRRYSAERYLKDNNYDFALYKKMQKARVGFHNVKEFKKVISSFIQDGTPGFNRLSPVPINSKDLGIEDGAHRTSLAYLFGIKMIPVQISGGKKTETYNRQWFVKKGFSDEELKIIDNEIEKLNKFLNE